MEWETLNPKWEENLEDTHQTWGEHVKLQSDM